MCNLYSMPRAQDAMRMLFSVKHDRAAKLLIDQHGEDAPTHRALTCIAPHLMIAMRKSRDCNIPRRERSPMYAKLLTTLAAIAFVAGSTTACRIS